MSERWPAKPAKGVKCMARNCSSQAEETCLMRDAYETRREQIRSLREKGLSTQAAAIKPLSWVPNMFLCAEHLVTFELIGLVVRNPRRKQLSLRSVTRELEQIRASLV